MEHFLRLPAAPTIFSFVCHGEDDHHELFKGIKYSFQIYKDMHYTLPH